MIGIVLNVGTHTIDAGQELKSYRSHDLVKFAKEIVASVRRGVNGKHSVLLQIWLLSILVCFVPSLLFIFMEVWRGN